MYSRPSSTPLLALLVLATACGDDAPAAGDSTTTDAETQTTTGPTTTVDPTTNASTETSSGTGTSESSTGVADESSTVDPDSSGSSSETGAGDLAVTISFAATVGGEPFACGQTYENVGAAGTLVEPRDLRFFVQDVRLIRADDDSEVPLVLDIVDPWQAETVALLDFEDATGACSEGGGNPEVRTELTGVVPAGDYDGVAFTVGVPEDINHADPLFAPSPLGATSMTWGWLYGYKFLKVELQEVVEPPTVPGDGLFHLGSNDCAGNPGVGDVVCSLPNRAEVQLDAFDATTNTVVLDVASLFAETDLSLDSQCHSFQDTCAPLFDRSGIDFATGLPSPTQVVFSVE